MITGWPEAFDRAERAVLRRGGALPAEVAEWVDAQVEQGGVRALPPERRGYLAALAHRLGRTDLGRRVLRGADTPALLLLGGVLAASAGARDEAADAFESALYLAADDLTRVKALANLAAVRAASGDVEQAERRVASARRLLGASGAQAPSVAVFLATVGAGLARMAGDGRRLRLAVEPLAEASRERVAELDPGDPRGYAVLGNLAAFELDLARAEGAPERMARAAEVLEIVVGGVAAVYGRDHPDALAALANLGAAELELACADESAERIDQATRLLGEAADRYHAVYGRGHPAVLGSAINHLLALLELARARRSRALLRTSTRFLAHRCGELAGVLGEHHPAAVLAFANLAAAQLDLARAQRTDRAVKAYAATAVRTLEKVEAAAVRVHGGAHPVTALARRELLAARSLLDGAARADAGRGGAAAGVAVSVRTATFAGWSFDSRFLQFDAAARRAATTAFAGLGPRPRGPEPRRTRREPGIEPDLLSAMADTVRPLDVGDTVTGTVVGVGADEVLVDIGHSTDAVIPAGELSAGHDADPREVVSVGDRVKALVLDMDDQARPVLSRKRAQYARNWDEVERIKAEGGTVTGTVTEVVSGGLVLDIGLRGFLPASLVERRRVRDLAPYVGRVLEAKVIKLDRDRNRVVLSRRAWLEETEGEVRRAFLDALRQGEVRRGVVSSIVDFGAFVDLGPMDGLVSIAELSWTRVGHPSEVVEVGQEVAVEVLAIDRDRERVSLSLRATREDPWRRFARLTPVGATVPGRVTKLVPFGAFVRLAEGVEGLVHLSELAWEPVEAPEEVVRTGAEVRVKILEIDPARRRAGLSLRQADPDSEDGEDGGA